MSPSCQPRRVTPALVAAGQSQSAPSLCAPAGRHSAAVPPERGHCHCLSPRWCRQALSSGVAAGWQRGGSGVAVGWQRGLQQRDPPEHLRPRFCCRDVACPLGSHPGEGTMEAAEGAAGCCGQQLCRAGLSAGSSPLPAAPTDTAL